MNLSRICRQGKGFFGIKAFISSLLAVRIILTNNV